MKSLLRILVVIVTTFHLASVMQAQVAVNRIDAGFVKEPLVIAQGDDQQVRFAAFAVASRVRLQVAGATGELVYDTGWREGNMIEWHIEDQQGLKLGDGIYRCQVMVEEVTGRVLRRQGEIQVIEGRVQLASPGDSRMEAGSSEDGKLYVLSPEMAWGWLPHNGREARIESGKGSLVLHAGRYEGTKEDAVPHVRLTPEGNVGIGIAEPRVRLDVGGWIRTTEGIQFPDGTVQRTAARAAVISSTPGEEFAGAGVIARTWPGRTGAAKVGSRISTSRLSDDGKASLGKPGLAHGGEATEGPSNTLFGQGAGSSITSGNWNSLFGLFAGNAVNSGAGNSMFGVNAGLNTTTGNDNSFFGSGAGTANTSGSNNSFFGHNAGLASTVAAGNSFFGYQAGRLTTAGWNSFFGDSAGFANTTGESNAFFGDSSGKANTTGKWNSFFGSVVGAANTTGEENSFYGGASGEKNTTGTWNSFFGAFAGRNNKEGNYNSFFGQEAGVNNTSGYSNAIFGRRAGSSNTTEDFNTFIGTSTNGVAGITNATALGYRAQVTQSNSLVLGSIYWVNGAVADTKVGIGTTAPERRFQVAETSSAWARGVAFEQFSNDRFASVFILRKSRGATPGAHGILQANDAFFNFTGQGSDGTQFVDGAIIRMAVDGTPGFTNMPGRMEFWTTPAGSASAQERARITSAGDVGIGTTTPGQRLDVNGNVRGWSFIATSDARLKEQIAPLEYGLEEVLQLRPVTWKWKSRPEESVQLGLIAQEVEKVLPELVTKGKSEEDMRGLNYTGLLPVLIKALQQQQAALQEQKATIMEQKAAMKELNSRIATLEREAQTRQR